jgi:hypothetical protein
VDALIDYRRAQSRWFGISLSFVVQPANAHTLLEFGEIARRRKLRIRMLPLNPRGPDGLDFYDDADGVRRILAHLDDFRQWAARHAPDYAEEIAATRSAIAAEAASRLDSALSPPARRLPVTH